MTRKKVIIFICCLIILGTLTATLLRQHGTRETSPSNEAGFSSVDTTVIGDHPDVRLTLRGDDTEEVFESNPIKAKINFNAIAPHWQENHATEENRVVEMRVSQNNKEWSPWTEIEGVGELRDGEPASARVYPETPLLIEGNYFQYRISLKRADTLEPSPEIFDLKVSQIDSRTPTPSPVVSFANKIKGLFGNDQVYAANADFRVVSRAEWGSPDPHGHLFKGTDYPYWHPTYAPLKQVFIHHTVMPSNTSDPAAAVRAVWQYQTYTRGWGDIGYNYVIDHNGTVYEGRFGGDNVTGGHVSNYNRGSLGIAILGCFDTGPECQRVNGGPSVLSNQILDSVATLISRKSAAAEIDPAGWNIFCKYDGTDCLNIPTVTGHRDAQQTACPGDIGYSKLPDIRNSAAAKNAERWNYSAKQLTYSETDLSSPAERQITLAFKNTGASTWTNTGDKLHLMTANPTNRDTPFQGSGWRTTWNPTLLNESSVPPGGTGTFTFNIRRNDNLPVGHFTDYYRLQTDSGATFGGYYGQPVRFFCTFGTLGNPRANGAIIRNVTNGAVYFLEDGMKRYIESPLAATSNGLNLAHIFNVQPHETDLMPTGTNITVADGVLMKSADSPHVYILDGNQKRLVSSPETMITFGMKNDQVHIVAPAVINGYTEGLMLHPDSAPPDGRLMRDSSNMKVYIIENGQRRWISSPATFSSYGYLPEFIGTVNPAVLNRSSAGSDIWQLRPGSLISAPDTLNIYVTDTVDGVAYRRWITHPNSYINSGFFGKTIYKESRLILDMYSESDPVACYQ